MRALRIRLRSSESTSVSRPGLSTAAVNEVCAAPGPFGETTARTTRLVAEFVTGDALRRRIRRPSRVPLLSRAPAGSQVA